TGTDFRRRVHVEGSDHLDKGWVALVDGGLLTHVQVEGKLIDVRRLSYPVSRFRYLRVRVFPDRNVDKDTPEISGAVVLRAVQSPGLDVTLEAQLRGPSLERVDGVAGSVWFVEFDGLTVPCGGLSFDVADEDFVRDYRLELVTPNEPNRVLLQGQWLRRAGEPKKPLEIRLDQEVAA